MKDFHPAVAEWFGAVFAEPTAPQKRGWPAIARGESTLILAPTGSGKTLTAFLWSLNRLMFEPAPRAEERCRVLYLSPLKALAVDVERNLLSPIMEMGLNITAESRTGDTGIAQLQRSAATSYPQVANALDAARKEQIAGYRSILDELAGNDGKREFFDAARQIGRAHV